MNIEEIAKKDVNLIISNLDNISLTEKQIDIILMILLSKQNNNEDLDLENDFLKVYKLRKEKKSCLNYMFFHSFIDFNWLNALKYSVDNIELQLITEESEVEIECIRRCVDENKPKILELILQNRPDIIDFYTKNKIRVDHLGIAYEEQKYKICSVLIQYKCFIDTFCFFYKGGSDKLNFDLNKIIETSDKINKLNNF